MEDSVRSYQSPDPPADTVCGCELCQARELLAWTRQTNSYNYIQLMADARHHPSDGLYPAQNPSTAGLALDSSQEGLYDYIGCCSGATATSTAAAAAAAAAAARSHHHHHHHQVCEDSSASPSCSEVSSAAAAAAAGYSAGLPSPAAAAAAAAASSTPSTSAEFDYPIAYFSRDGIAHLRLNKHIALEVSDFAIRVVNNRNNSALAVSSAATIGSLYHYNCRGWFDTGAQRVALAFDRDCDLLLRAANKPSLVRKGREFYRMNHASISYAKEEPIYIAQEDLTHKRLLRRNSDENFQLRVHDMVKSSRVCRDSSGNVNLDLLSVRAELHATGELRVWWTGPDGFVNQLIVSPTSGAFTLVTSSLEIVNTPKCEVTVKFGCLSILLGLRQLHLSNGVKNCLLDLYPMDAFGWGFPPDYYGMAAGGGAACFQHQASKHQQQQHLQQQQQQQQQQQSQHQHQHQHQLQQQYQHQHQHQHQQDYSCCYEDTEDDAPAWFIRQQQARRMEHSLQQHHYQHHQQPDDEQPHQQQRQQQQRQQHQQRQPCCSSSADVATATTATRESSDDDLEEAGEGEKATKPAASEEATTAGAAS